MEKIVVLIVDDARAAREAMAELLRRHDYHAVTAANGFEALSAIEADEPAVVILDIEMPVMDGLGALHAIRQDPRWRHLPVVILSGNEDEHSLSEARRLGASDYFVKGATPLKVVLRRVQHYASRLA